MNKRAYIISLLLLTAVTLSAAPRYSTGRVTHWLGISLAGFEANPILGGNTSVKALAGGGGQAALLYEIHRGHFFFNIGVGADYTLTATALNSYADEFPRVDYTGEEVLYRYIYSSFLEQQTQLRVVVPFQFGYRFGDWFYAAVGAAFRTEPLLNGFSSATRMLAEGEYDRFIQPIRNTEAYGYWPEADYSGKGKVQSATHEMAVEVELGARIPLYYGVQMRVGAYLGYDIPLLQYGRRSDTPLVDYTAVDSNPTTWTQANLAENIRFNSMLDAHVINRNAQRIRAGIKLTFVFNVTQQKQPCMCTDD